MFDWSEGYMKDINYTVGYYPDLNPQRCILPLLMENIAPPAILDNQYNACELGFGMGVSINIHSNNNAQWYGTDFNPAHALFAQNLAQGKENLFLSDQSFQAFCTREDLPDFDYISLHGIFSWISPENQQVIVDFVERKLKVGGVLYISYNAQPGWSTKAPLRHLVEQYYKMQPSMQGSGENLKSALSSVQQTVSLCSAMSKKAPLLVEEIEHIAGMDARYVAHEYLNEHWQPMYFSEMEAYLKQAKMSFACSANYVDDYTLSLFNEEQMAFLAGIKDPSLRQTIKDFFLNRTFRRDLWVKGKRELTDIEKEQIWNKLSIILTTDRENVKNTLTYGVQVNLNEKYINALLDILSDYKIHSVATLRKKLEKEIPTKAFFELLAILEARNEIMLAHSDDVIARNKKSCEQLNQRIVDHALSPTEMGVMASPVTGSGIYCNDVELLFIAGYLQGIKQDKLENHAWKRLKAMNKSLTKDGELLEGEAANLAELKELKAEFVKKKLNLLKGLQILS
ncbi:class I SAM-dependent methyltransferase [Moraxella sp. ZY200743]|uniref:class I SAM-dependent methyltransferase n=1 Tax=Moraxella sp. ZY200743 TaxID=2911970 RepID=UPI003D7E5395